MKNILIAVDFAENPKNIIDKATKMLATTGAKIWLVHIAAPDPDFIGYDVGPQYIREDRAKELRVEHKKLASYVKKLEDKGHKAEALLIQGSTIDTLIAEATKLKTDIIVMGHHQHGWLYKMFNEETATETISKASVPVLIIPLK